MRFFKMQAIAVVLAIAVAIGFVLASPSVCYGQDVSSMTGVVTDQTGGLCRARSLLCRTRPKG